jgi:hypothetical protein
MAKRSTSSDKVRIDPIFPIPEGSEDQFVREDMDVLEGNVESADLSFLADFDDSVETGLEIPQDFTIVSQTLRRAPGGQQVVDVVIEVPDVIGATNYEIQVAKL